VALELLDYLRQHYPQALMARYGLPEAGAMTDEQVLGGVGRRRGALQSGGRENLQKAAEIAIHDFRSGALGRITLETPAEFAQWRAVGEKLDAERQVKKDAIEQARLIRLKKIPRPARVEEPHEPSD
jgi:ribosome biogenesis GTPase A